jgi:hypothetical protein
MLIGLTVTIAVALPVLVIWVVLYRRHAFATKANRRRMALSLFGATAGQGVVWYTGQFYALFYLQKVLAIESRLANILVAAALLLAMPLFVVFGALSDRAQEADDVGLRPGCRQLPADLQADADRRRQQRRRGRPRPTR